MTSKEKSVELYSKYYNRLEHTLSEDYSPHEKDIAKQCALIAVDEIILEQCKSSEKKDARYQDERLIYWQEVKQEIEKL